MIPLIALATAAVVSPAEARGAYVDWLIRYGAVIVTFVGALHWGALMRSPGAPPSEQWFHPS